MQTILRYIGEEWDRSLVLFLFRHYHAILCKLRYISLKFLLELMESLADSQARTRKELLELLRERMKQQPKVNSQLQATILSSACAKDYEEIVKRIGLTKKASESSINQLIGYAIQTGKFGIPVTHLQSANKNWDERLRIYFLDLLKTLKGLSEQAGSIWKYFKKTRESLKSTGSKHEHESASIVELMGKIKSFKEELDGKMYTISKSNLAESKTEASSPVWSSQKKIGENALVNKQLQELRLRVASLHDAYFKLSLNRESVTKEESEQLLGVLLKKIKEEPVQPSGQVQLKKKDSSFVGQSGDLKQKILNLLTRLLSTRNISQMKILEKEVQILVAKKPDYMQLKPTLKFFIQDQELYQSSASLSKYPTSLPSNEILRIQELESSAKNLAVKNQQLQVSLAWQKELKRENIELHELVDRLKKQLDEERIKFSYLDRSAISTFSQQPQSLLYQESTTNVSPFKSGQNTPSQIRELSSPGSENRTEVMVEVVHNYELLQQTLRKQISNLVEANSSLITERNDLKEQMDAFQIENEVYKSEIQQHKSKNEELMKKNNHLRAEIERLSKGDKEMIENAIEQFEETERKQEDPTWMEAFFIEEKIYQSEIQRLKGEIQEYRATIEQFWAEQIVFKAQLRRLTQEKEQYKSTVDHFWPEEKIYKAQIQKLIQEREEYKSTIEQFWIQERVYKGQIQRLKAEKEEYKQNLEQFWIEQGLYKSQLSKLSTEKEEYRSTLEQFWVEERIYKGELQKLKAENVEYRSVLQQFWVEQQQYKSHISQLTERKYELEQAVSNFFIEERLYKSQIQKGSGRIHELQEQVKVLQANQVVGGSVVVDLGDHEEYRRVIEQFWLEFEQYKTRIVNLTEKNYQLEQAASTFFAEQRQWQRQLEKYRAELHRVEQNNRVSSNEPKDNSFIDAFFIEERLYKEEILKLKAENIEYKSMFQQFWVEQGLYKGELEKLKRILQELQQTKKSSALNREGSLQVEVARLQSLLKSKQDLISQLQNQLSFERDRPKKASEQILVKSKLLKQQNKVLDKIQKSKTNLIQSLQNEVQELKLSNSYYQQCGYFDADIFDDNESQKNILIKLLAEETGQRIVKTKLLYKHDPLNKASFHKYIDNVESILVVVQTKNAIVGGFYAGQVGEKEKIKGNAFLFSIEEQQCYPCVVPEKAVSYDKYFLIFGNSELRVNPQSEDVFSNFGIINAYYNKKGKKVEQFLRQGSLRETKFKHFEVYKVDFEQHQFFQPEQMEEEEQDEIK